MKSLTLDGQTVTIEEQLGGGRFSEVFAARTGEEHVVVKIAREEQLGAEVASVTGAFAWAEALARRTGSFGAARVDPSAMVSAEADLIARVGSGLLPKIVGRGTSAQRAFFVMERVMGPTLRDAAAEPTPSHFAALAAELDRLRTHRLMAIHGDLKPDNLMLDQRGGVRLLDPSTHGWVIAEGRVDAMLMTPLYNPLAEPSDVPALALTIFETHYGEHPLLYADDSRRAPRRSERLERVCAMLRATGRAPALERLLSMPRLREIAPALSRAAETAVYGALHLRVEPDGTLDWHDGIASCTELVSAFGAPR